MFTTFSMTASSVGTNRSVSVAPASSTPASRISIKELDRVSWDMSESEWIDQEVSEDNLVTFDGGSKHYSRGDIETYLDEVECELEAAG